MPWLVLIISAILEAIWATALGQSEGLTAPRETTIFVIALVASMGGLGYAVRSIPIGTGYAVWTGLGAGLTVTWAMATGSETFSPIKAILIAGVVAAVLGLKLLPAGPTETAEHQPSA